MSAWPSPEGPEIPLSSAGQRLSSDRWAGETLVVVDAGAGPREREEEPRWRPDRESGVGSQSGKPLALEVG